MKGLNVVCEAEVLVHFPPLETSDEAGGEVAFTLQVADAPFFLEYAPTATHWKLRTRTRGDWPAMANATLSMHKETALVDLYPEEAAAYLPQYYSLCRGLSALMAAEGWQCENGEAIVLTVENGALQHRTVKGEDRPPLLCVRPGGCYEQTTAYWACVDEGNIEALEKAAEAGDVAGMKALAALYTYGGVRADKDAAALFRWNCALAEAGDEAAMEVLALQYAHKSGTARDFEQAAVWFQKAGNQAQAEDMRLNAREAARAQAGDPHAQAALASTLMLQAGKFDGERIEEEYREALDWAEQAAQTGDATALWLCANAYENGLGVNADLERAVDYYQKGADAGNIDCIYGLGLHYLNGEVLLADVKKGFRLILQAAQAGNLDAMRTAADCYINGTGTQKDKNQALYWYKQVAKQTTDPGLEEAILYLTRV